jgi:hypothetical protein
MDGTNITAEQTKLPGLQIGVLNHDFSRFSPKYFHRFHRWLFMFDTFGVRNFQRGTNPEGVKYE